jgi:UPF0716 family protein affecting phage T7 exclusion
MPMETQSPESGFPLLVGVAVGVVAGIVVTVLVVISTILIGVKVHRNRTRKETYNVKEAEKGSSLATPFNEELDTKRERLI